MGENHQNAPFGGSYKKSGKTTLFDFPPLGSFLSIYNTINTREYPHYHHTRHFSLSQQLKRHESHIDHVQHHRFMACARPTRRGSHSGGGWSLRGDIHAPNRNVSEPGCWYHTSSFCFFTISRETSDSNPRKAHDSGPTFYSFLFIFKYGSTCYMLTTLNSFEIKVLLFQLM